MFTAASASVVYLSFGGIPFDYGLATFLSGLLWTILGQVGRLLVCDIGSAAKESLSMDPKGLYDWSATRRWLVSGS